MPIQLPLDTLASTAQALLVKAIASDEKASQFYTAARSHLEEAQTRVEAGEAAGGNFELWLIENVPAIAEPEVRQRCLPAVERREVVRADPRTAIKHKGGRGKTGGMRQMAREQGVSHVTILKDLKTGKLPVSQGDEPEQTVVASDPADWLALMLAWNEASLATQARFRRYLAGEDNA